MLFRTQIIFCSSELRLHFRIAEVGSLLSLNRAWRAQVTLTFRVSVRCLTLSPTEYATSKRVTLVFTALTLSFIDRGRPGYN